MHAKSIKEVRSLFTEEEKKLLVKTYTINLKSNNIDEANKKTADVFLDKINKEREKSKVAKVSLEQVFELLIVVEELIADIDGDKFKNKFDERLYIEKRCAELASRLRRPPGLKDMLSIGIDRDKIRSTHGSIEHLNHYSRFNHPTYYESSIEFKELVSEEMTTWIQKAVSENDLFSVFALTAAPYCRESLRNVMNMHAIEGGIAVIVPMCKRVEDIDQDIINMFLEKKLILVLEDLVINDNLKVKYVNQNEKSMDVTKGFQKEDIGKSIIFAGIKQQLKPLPVKKGGHARMHISTGSISVNHHRASINHNKNPHVPRILKAESNHFMGGTLIEKIDNKFFIPTQIMFDDNKEFTIYGRKYGSALLMNRPNSYDFGDIHEKEHAKPIVDHSLTVCKALGIKEGVFHDLYDCASGSHWNDSRMLYKAFQYLKGESSWATELRGTSNFLNQCTTVFEKCHIVDSNHDDMLLRALDKGGVFKDPENAFLAFLIAPTAVISFFEKEATHESPLNVIAQKLNIDLKFLKETYGHLESKASVLEFAVKMFGLKSPEKVNWMDLESKLVRGGYHLPDHGHKGNAGTKGSGMAFSNNFDKMIFGHTHAPYQDNHVLGLGHNVSSLPGKRPQYALGGTTTWMYADIMIYDTERCHHVFTICGHRSRFLSEEALSQYRKGKLSGLKKREYPLMLEELGDH